MKKKIPLNGNLLKLTLMPTGAGSNSLTGCRETEDGHAQMESILKELIAHIVC